VNEYIGPTKIHKIHDKHMILLWEYIMSTALAVDKPYDEWKHLWPVLSSTTGLGCNACAGFVQITKSCQSHSKWMGLLRQANTSTQLVSDSALFLYDGCMNKVIIFCFILFSLYLTFAFTFCESYSILFVWMCNKIVFTDLRAFKSQRDKNFQND